MQRARLVRVQQLLNEAWLIGSDVIIDSDDYDERFLERLETALSHTEKAYALLEIMRTEHG